MGSHVLLQALEDRLAAREGQHAGAAVRDVDPGPITERKRPCGVGVARLHEPGQLVLVARLDLGREHAGRRARRLGTRYGPLEDHDLLRATARELQRGRATHHAAADDDDSHGVARTPSLTRTRVGGLLSSMRFSRGARRPTSALRCLVVLLGLLVAPDVQAFCGFYVSGADAKLFANASQVVLMREGTRTVLSMQNDYQGPPASFAMVVPVPVVLQKENVKTLPPAIFARIDQLDAPRLVEYWERDPCAPPAPSRPVARA